MIPNTFTLGGLNFHTEIVDSIDDTGLGRVINCLGTIRIAKKFYGKDIPQESQERNFYHEVVHAILDEIGYKELSNNEQFTDAFSSLLYQFEATKK
jgi:hypothetical protein